ncbi:putative FtsQ [metagenome]|uniref:Putative FtsQ n=1 Tax=metagenome TaxID=256318 RepID=A0A2P2CFQ3_9ZZZZ
MCRMGAEPRVEHVRAPHALARALAATVVVLIGAVSAHTWAGGTVPTAPGLVLITAVVLGGGVLLFTRDVPVRLLLPAVAAAQLGLHESFGLVTDHVHAGHDAMTSPDPGWTWRMVAAHLFVTVLTAVLWWAGGRAAGLVVSLVDHPAPVVVPRLRAPHDEVRPCVSLVHLLVSPRRGPPLAVPHT